MKKIILAIAVLAAIPACASKPSNQDPQGSRFYGWHQEPLEQAQPFTPKIEGDYRDYRSHNQMAPQFAGVSAGQQSQAGSFLSHNRALRQAEYLMKANRGAIASVERALVGRQTFYRVIVDKPCNGLMNQRGVGCFAKGGK